MNLKYESLAAHEVAGQDASARTHRLTFSEPQEGMGSPLGIAGGNSVSIVLTKAEAAEFVLGSFYTITITPATEA